MFKIIIMLCMVIILFGCDGPVDKVKYENRSTNQWQEELDNKDPENRIEALNKITESYLDILERMSSDKDQSVRKHVIELRKKVSKNNISSLLHVLKSEESVLKVEYDKALCDVITYPIEQFNLFLETNKDDENIASILIDISIANDLMADFTGAVIRDQKSKFRKNAFMVIENVYRRNQPVVFEALKDSDLTICMQSLMIIKMFLNRDVVKQIINYLSDTPDYFVLNSIALNILINLTGKDFEFDIVKWRQWFDMNEKDGTVLPNR